MNESTAKNALVSSVIYTLSLAFYIAAIATAVPWFLLCSIASTIAFSFLAAHGLEDQNIIMFQFIYWCISWAWLGWKILTCACFHGIMIIDRLTLFSRLFTALPAFLPNSTMFTIIALMLAIIFADALFFTIVSSTGGTLGRYGTIHGKFWEKWWNFSLSIRDAVVGVLGQRRVVTNTPAEREGEQSRVAIVPSPVETEASSPPPPQYCVSTPISQVIP